jgi:hypothetical protein
VCLTHAKRMADQNVTGTSSASAGAPPIPPTTTSQPNFQVCALHAAVLRTYDLFRPARCSVVCLSLNAWGLLQQLPQGFPPQFAQQQQQQQQQVQPQQQPQQQFQQTFPHYTHSAQQAEQLRAFWKSQQIEVEGVGNDPAEFKNHQLPLARIKKVLGLACCLVCCACS